MQKRIYRASQRGDVKNVRRLQKMLMKSWAARSLAVRRISQDNQGKKTAGVDGIKSLTPKQRLNLVDELKLGATNNIEVHHIRKLADVAQKGKSERPDWMKKMAARRRKTLVVCLECHHKIQYGRYDGKALSRP